MNKKEPYPGYLPRSVHRMLRGAYRRLPVRFQERVFIFLSRFTFARLFFRASSLRSIRYKPWEQLEYDSGTQLIDLSKTASFAPAAPGSLAVHCHVYYVDLIPEFYRHLQLIPFQFDLYVSTTSDEGRGACLDAFRKIDRVDQLVVDVVPNRGRDIAPMLCHFGAQLRQYDFIAHAHTKKSLYNEGRTLGWREYLLQSIFGSANEIKKILGMFQENPNVGMVYPQGYRNLPYYAYCWLANEALGKVLCGRLDIRAPRGYFDYPAGSTFWARTSALLPLFNLGLQLSEFDEECGQTDGTLAHALERMLGIVPATEGYVSFILRDRQSPSWSTFRIDQQYLSRTMEYYRERIGNKNIKLVAFDIFDTLLTRPLLTADHTKKLIAFELSERLADAFLAYRQRAELETRRNLGIDIDLNRIYRHFQVLTGLDWADVAIIRDTERRIEISSVQARPAVIQLMTLAKALGKRVVLVSDMFLPIEDVEEMLKRNDISGWDRIYLSSNEGVRKDTGKLYQRLLEQELIDGGPDSHDRRS